MVTTVHAFDTLATARKLKAAGVDDAQAEAHAEAIASAVHSGRDDLATKADLAGVKADVRDIKGKIDDLEGKIDGIKGEIGGIKGEIASLKGKIDGAKWGLGLFLGFLAALWIATAARIFGAF